LVLGAGVVAAALLLWVAAGGWNWGATPSGALGSAGEPSSAYADLSLVPVIASPTPAGGAVAPATGSPGPVSAGPSVSPSASALGAVRARRIRIERLDIDLRIVEGDGIDAPIGKAAHYPGSSWPGGGTNIYIYGHAREGMFLSLWKARVGDVVELDLVDGTTRTYLVDQVLPKVPWDAVKYTRPTPTEQLTLQTSTSYHPTSPRFIVTALPAP
jgi:LPXTG-site transpeptidase (sortase) family protein